MSTNIGRTSKLSKVDPILDTPEKLREFVRLADTQAPALSFKRLGIKGLALQQYISRLDYLRSLAFPPPIGMDQLSIYIPSNRPDLAKAAQASMGFDRTVIWDGQGYPSFSKLINCCVADCQTEIIIISNDKARATQEHLHKIVKALNDGFAFVGLYRFGFFGFYKQLFRTIGGFDERFVGGNFEDVDFKHRLKEADLALYETEEVPYENFASSWQKNYAQTFYNSKWKEEYDQKRLIRLKPDLPFEYPLGPSRHVEWLGWKRSVLLDNQNFYMDIEVVNNANRELSRV